VTIWPALNTKFAVCLDRAHGELTIARRVPRPRAHGESGSVAMCLPSGHTANLGALLCTCRPGTRRIWQRCRVPTVLAHGESESVAVCLPSGHTANSRRRRQLAVTAFARFFSPCAYIYTRRKGLPCARLLAHGKQGLCRPRGCRRCFVVGHRRRSLRRVSTGLRRARGLRLW